MRLLAIIIGIMLIILVASGSQHASASAPLGAVTLASQNGAAAAGWVNLSADGNDNTYVIVQATNMGALSTHAFALMTPDCATVTQLLNPIVASIAGDGGSTSVASGKPDGTWWFGILSGASSDGTVVACGPAGGTSAPTSTSIPPITPTSGGGLVPVHQGTAPVVNPNATPTPLGS